MIIVEIDGRSVDFDAATHLMDDDLRDDLNLALAGDVTEQQFVDAYCEAHRTKFGEQFIVI